MGKKDAPDPPDYRAAAEEQGESSERIARQQTYANRPTRITPFGTEEWSATQGQGGTTSYTNPFTGQTYEIPNVGGAGPEEWTQTTTLSPELQAALDDQQGITRQRSGIAQGLMSRVGDELGPMVDFDDYQALQGANPEQLQRGLDYSGASQVGDPNDVRNRAEEALYGRSTSRLDPMWEQRQQDMEIKLRGQGLTPGDEAYDRAMGNLERGRTDAYQTAQNEAVMGGGAESDRMFGQMMARRGQDVSEINRQGTFGNTASGQQFNMGMTGAGFNNQLRQQQIAEEMQRRGYSLNEVNAALSGQQVALPNMPDFQNANRGQATQYLGAANMGYQGQLDQFNAEQGAFQGLMSGLGGLAGVF